MKKILIRHLGNMGDAVFFLPPVFAAVKEAYPQSHITFVGCWGFKEKRRRVFKPWEKYEFWGNRNQGGFTLHLFATNPHIDQLIHWHDQITDLTGSLCTENGKRIPTWSPAHYESQKASYHQVYELDMGITHTENPLKRIFSIIGLPEKYRGNYTISLTQHDLKVAGSVMENYPHPRIVLIEGIDGSTTRGWDPGKVKQLEQEIKKTYGVNPIWFGGKFAHYYQGRPLTLRENIATLTYCDVGIGVLSGPLHFAVAVGLPTITLYADQPIHRTAPGYFLNPYISDPVKKHRTILGPTSRVPQFLKHDKPSHNLNPTEARKQQHKSWLSPGRQSTKTPLAAITVREVMTVLADMVKNPVS